MGFLQALQCTLEIWKASLFKSWKCINSWPRSSQEPKCLHTVPHFLFVPYSKEGGETDQSTKPSFHLLSPPQGESGDSGWDLSLSVPPHLPKTEEKEFLCLYFISAPTPIHSHLIKVFYRFRDVGKHTNRCSLLQQAPSPH